MVRYGDSFLTLKMGLQNQVDYFYATPNFAGKASLASFKDWCDDSSAYSDIFVCDGYRPIS